MSTKIAIIINSSWNIFNFRKGLVTSFIEESHEVVAITPNDDYVDQLKEWGVRHVPVKLEGSGLNPMKDMWYVRQLKRILKAEKPNIILSYTIKANIYGSLAARFLGIPIISNVSGLGTTFLWKGWVKRTAIFLYNRAFRSTSFIFFQNGDDRKLFLENVKVSPSKTGLLPGSGINLEDFNFNPPEFKNPIKFLMISRLILEKGVLEFIQSAESICKTRTNVEFQILGSYEPRHKRSIEELDFESIEKENFITYLGHSDDVKQMISQADVVVLPSYREGTPRTLLEAAAMSRPLIATNAPGCREVVSDGINGFLCDVKSAESLTTKIDLFLALNQEEKRAMGVASRKLVVNKFDEKIVIEEYSRKIKQLLNRPND
ncbi:MAG: glycosyltransferase family 4 protein [Cytophagales bacterium]|nr:glycosyltransferase family 4 protein [Cytophagales bacterium]